ncbi:hypothetical protein AB0L54_34570, partial [Streptomyces sp. NPDC052196]|uniref:hypothetical protein n=1 Tax=Streptomyces sp. NPDC052196 TaxID=3156691 RepID=UPI0034457CD2
RKGGSSATVRDGFRGFPAEGNDARELEQPAGCSGEPEQHGSPGDTARLRRTPLTWAFPSRGTMCASAALITAGFVLENQNKPVYPVLPPARATFS